MTSIRGLALLLALSAFTLSTISLPALAESSPSSPSRPKKAKQCSDGIDNDGDGLIDFGQDPGCKSANDNKEKNKKPKPPKQCADGLDNDGDGLIDYPLDPGCSSSKDDKEKHKKKDPKVPPTPSPTPSPSPTPTPAPPDDGTTGDGVSLRGRQIFLANNPWNQDISGSPVDSNSNALIASMGLTRGLHPDFGTFWEDAPIGIPYTVVSGSQAKSFLQFEYDDESDVGPYPIPANPPIEGGTNSDGDRHVLIIDKDNWMLYELYAVYRSGGGWRASSGAIFNMNSNDLRPAGWTSADAAGLPILPGLVRYDEVMEQGEITHALRFTAQHTRRGYVYPARHAAGADNNASSPPMGMRVRLKASFPITGFPEPVQVILRALKKYGMFLADNGSNWYISGAHDPRWDDDLLSNIRYVEGQDFEVVQMGTIVPQ